MTNLVNAGVPKHEAKSSSGHGIDSVFDGYSIGNEKQKRAALRAAPLYTEQLNEDRTVIPLRAQR